MQPIWHGNQVESELLIRAIVNNCECEVNPSGTLRAACAAHRMLTHDQRALNGLLFARAIRQRLVHEEWLQADPATIESNDLVSSERESSDLVSQY